MGVRDRVGTSGYRLPVPAMSREQSIAVYVRVRSPGADVALRCLTTDERTSTVKLHTPAGSDDRTFRYDSVGGENTTQEEVFDAVGRPLSHANMEGYNATVFAYGQTGSGKTYTMYGPEFGGASSSAPIPSDSRGLTPRLSSGRQETQEEHRNPGRVAICEHQEPSWEVALHWFGKLMPHAKGEPWRPAGAPGAPHWGPIWPQRPHSAKNLDFL